MASMYYSVSSIFQNQACQCTEPNQICVSGSCVCDIGFTDNGNGCQPTSGMCTSTYNYAKNKLYPRFSIFFVLPIKM